MSYLNKALFIESINELERACRYQEGLNNFFSKNDVDGYIFQPDCSVMLVKVLHEIFSDIDIDEWISYYCFELDFGKKWKPGCVKEDGKDIQLSNPDQLYDFLMSMSMKGCD